MNIKEIFKDQETKIFVVTNIYDEILWQKEGRTTDYQDYEVEKTDWQIIPDQDVQGLIVIAYILSKEGKILEKVWADIDADGHPLVIYKLQNQELLVEDVDVILSQGLSIIPAVASEHYGDLENYWIKNHPQVGIQVLKEGLKYAKNPFVIYEHLTYIYDKENLEEDFIVPGEEPDEPLVINNEAEARAAIEKYREKYKQHEDDLSIRMSNRYAKKIYAARVWLADRGLIKMRHRN